MRRRRSHSTQCTEQMVLRRHYSEESTDSEEEDGAKPDLFEPSGANAEDKMEVDLNEHLKAI